MRFLKQFKYKYVPNVVWRRPYSYIWLLQARRFASGPPRKPNLPKDAAGAVGSSHSPIIHHLIDQEHIAKLVRTVSAFRRWLWFSSVGVVVGSFFFYLNWTRIRSRVSQEGAEVLVEGIRREEVTSSATALARSLLDELLQDKRLAKQSGQWLAELLSEAGPQLERPLVDLLQREAVINEVRNVADNVVKHLCSQDWVAEYIGALLLRAINTETAKEGAAVWAQDLLNDPIVQAQSVDLVQTAILSSEVVRASATELAEDVVQRMLANGELISLVKDRLISVLEDPDFKSRASVVGWDLLKRSIAPRWLADDSGTVKPNSAASKVPDQRASSTVHDIVDSDRSDAATFSLVRANQVLPQQQLFQTSVVQNDCVKDPTAPESTWVAESRELASPVEATCLDDADSLGAESVEFDESSSGKSTAEPSRESSQELGCPVSQPEHFAEDVKTLGNAVNPDEDCVISEESPEKNITALLDQAE